MTARQFRCAVRAAAQAAQRIDAKLETLCELNGGGATRNAEIHCARSADPLVAHDFETESLALIQADHSCAFEGAYINQHVNSTAIGAEETIALRDVKPSHGSNCHSASSHE
jgi:hypothetical protein